MNILSTTIKCKDCDGVGKLQVPSKESTGGTKDEACKTCHGSGMVIDNKVADIIKKYCPALERAEFPKMLTEIYDHYERKLTDSYSRGVVDGKEFKSLPKQ